MTRSTLRPLLASVVAALALVVAACGGDDNGSGGSSSSGGGAAARQETGGKQGGVLRQLGSSDVDYLDPGHTYYTGGFQVLYPTQRTLYSFKPDNATDPVPDLAADKPQISDDLKTITVKIKPNVKFSPPVNRAVTSKDVKYAFDRFFSVNVGGQYPSYFSAIEGTPSSASKGVQHISGITTPDDTTIVFKLSRPEAVSVAAALVMPITMPVPEEYAKEFDAKSPS